MSVLALKFLFCHLPPAGFRDCMWQHCACNVAHLCCSRGANRFVWINDSRIPYGTLWTEAMFLGALYTV